MLQLATAADMPPELFTVILDCVAQDTKPSPWKDTLALTPEQKRHLSACALTCVWWAQQCRPRIFGRLTIRSVEDLRAIRAFMTTTSARLRSIEQYIHLLIVEQNLTDLTWFHNVHTLFAQSLGRNISNSHIPIRLVILSSAPSIPNRSAFSGGPTRRSILFRNFPRSLPLQLRQCNHLVLQDVHCANLEAVLSLTKEVHVRSKDVRFMNVTWDTRSSDPAPTPPSPQGPLLVSRAGIRIRASECTDVASVVWSALRTQASAVTEQDLTDDRAWLLVDSLDFDVVFSLSQILLQSITTAKVYENTVLHLGGYSETDFIVAAEIGMSPDRAHGFLCSVAIADAFSGPLTIYVEFYTWTENWSSSPANLEAVHVDSLAIFIGGHSSSSTALQRRSEAAMVADWKATVDAISRLPSLQRVLLHFASHAVLVTFMESYRDDFMQLEASTSVEFVYHSANTDAIVNCINLNALQPTRELGYECFWRRLMDPWAPSLSSYRTDKS